MNCLSKCNQGLRTLSVSLAVNSFYIFHSSNVYNYYDADKEQN